MGKIYPHPHHQLTLTLNSPSTHPHPHPHPHTLPLPLLHPQLTLTVSPMRRIISYPQSQSSLSPHPLHPHSLSLIPNEYRNNLYSHSDPHPHSNSHPHSNPHPHCNHDSHYLQRKPSHWGIVMRVRVMVW